MNRPDVARFELAVYDFLDAFVRQNHIQCDWEVVGGVHAMPTEEILHLAERRLEKLAQTAPDLAALCTITSDPKELRRLRVPAAAGALVQSCAAKCWPYKLVAWVLEDLLSMNMSLGRSSGGGASFNLQTNTPATHLQREEGETAASSSWIVHTPRGQLAASQVLLATNGYTSRLLPRLTGVITPVRGQVCALEPPDGDELLEHSHAFVSEGSKSDDYLVQRGAGELILGGERLAARGGEVGISNDDEVNPVVGKKLRRVLRSQVELVPDRRGRRVEKEIEEEEEEEEEEGEEGDEDDGALRASYEWTGIMGYSSDGHPWVGEVLESSGGDGEGGLWIAAGYTGHGMPVAAGCAIAVAGRMVGKTPEIALPRGFAMTEERMTKAKMMESTNALEVLKAALTDW